MQPVRGRARSRGSQEFLLARGIAVQRRGGNRLPVLSGPRRLITRSPTSIRLARLGQDRVRGKWLVLCVLFLGSAVVYGAIVGGQTAKIYDALTGGIEHLAIVSGFGVEADYRRRPAARDRRIDHRGARRRPRYDDAQFRYRRRQGAPRSRSLDQTRASHAAVALDPPSRRRGADAVRRLAEQGSDLCGRRRGRGSRPGSARSLCELASGRGRGRGEVRRRIVRTIGPL